MSDDVLVLCVKEPARGKMLPGQRAQEGLRYRSMLCLSHGVWSFRELDTDLGASSSTREPLHPIPERCVLIFSTHKGLAHHYGNDSSSDDDELVLARSCDFEAQASGQPDCVNSAEKALSSMDSSWSRGQAPGGQSSQWTSPFGQPWVPHTQGGQVPSSGAQPLYNVAAGGSAFYFLPQPS